MKRMATHDEGCVKRKLIVPRKERTGHRKLVPAKCCGWYTSIVWILVTFTVTTNQISHCFESSPISFHKKSSKSSPSHFFISPSAASNENQQEIRGINYRASNNSTILTAKDAAREVNVLPPIDAPKSTWKRAFQLHQTLLPTLHIFDSSHPPNSELCLACLWWKALSGNDPHSPVFDDNLSYDLLPSVTRSIVNRRLTRFYPRLHHANVEIRTAYLDRILKRAVGSDCRYPIRLISIGAGYDVRSIRLKLRNVVEVAYELDRPEVVSAKQIMLSRLLSRRRRRRYQLNEGDLPKLVSVDLNQLSRVRTVLQSIITSDEQNRGEKWRTIFLLEGVMIYLENGIPGKLLQVCADVLRDNNNDSSSMGGGYLCFADRLENVPGGDLILAEEELGRNGWELVDWLPKPGLARHMGFAKLAN